MKFKCLYGVLGIMLFSSCQNTDNKEELLSEETEFGFFTKCQATIEGVEPLELKTKVTFDGTNFSLKWNDGDQFAIHHERNTPHNVAGYPDGISCYGIFQRNGSDFDLITSTPVKNPSSTHPLYAYYPAKGFQEYLGDGRFKINLPTQQYRKGELSNDSYPMFSKTYDGIFKFKNVASVLRVNIKAKDDNLVVKKITLSSSEINMSGDGIVYLDQAGLPVLEMQPSDGEHPAILNCPEGVQLIKSVAVPFDFVLPPYNYGINTWTITVETETDKCIYNVKGPFLIERSKGYQWTKNLNLTLSAGGIGIEGDIAD